MTTLLLTAVLSAVIFHDNADLFDKEFIKETVEKERPNFPEVVIETFKDADTKVFHSERELHLYFAQWVRKAAKHRDSRGIYILICLRPAYVAVDFHESLIDSGHPRREAATIRRTMAPALINRRYKFAITAGLLEIDNLWNGKKGFK